MNRSKPGTGRYITSLLLGVLMVIAIISLARLTWTDVLSSLSAIPAWGYALFFGMYFVHLFLVSCRWSVIVRMVNGGGSYTPGFFYYNIALAQMARLLPLSHIAGFGTKILSLKVDANTPVSRGLHCGMVEAIFNLFAIFLLIATGLIINLGGGSPGSCLLAASGAAICIAVFILKFDLLLRILFWFVRKLSTLAGHILPFPGWFDSVRKVVDDIHFSPRQVTKILTYTLSFYAIGLSRALFLLWLLGIDVAAVDFYAMYSFSLIASLVGITPAGLGVVELGWMGILLHLGVSAELAASYALVKRIVDDTSLALLAGMGYAAFKIGQARSRTSNHVTNYEQS